jgi:hypothetical protein
VSLPSERAPSGGLGRVIPAWVLLAVVAPVATAAVPLAALLGTARLRAGRELALAGVAAGIGLWWLVQAGELPDQFLRAAVVIATAAFVLLSLRTGVSYAHRAMLATAIAMTAGSALLYALGSSWEELRWWVEYRAGLSARLLIGQGARGGLFALSASQLADMERWLQTLTRTLSDFAPAMAALQLLAGFGIAGVTYRRIAPASVGTLPGRLRDFRFTEHFGWAAVVPLALLLVPKLAAAKLAAANVLAVAAALYGVRGIAVASYGLAMIGAGGFFLWAALVAILLLMLPFVVGGAILLGVLDAGLNLRRRWSEPASR